MNKVIARSNTENRIINLLKKYNQMHVFNFWNQLKEREKNKLMSEISSVDLKKVLKYYKEFQKHKKNEYSLQPTEYLSIKDRSLFNNIKTLGENALKLNKIAFLTVAGGQGSRLGYNHPKGFYPTSPIKEKPLFQLFAEKIYFYSMYYNNDFNWYIMTSEFNYKDTINFFIKNNYFNLKKQNIIFFKQGMLPALTLDGKLILCDKDKLFLNPDGHGGILKALLKTGLLDDMKSKGIKHLSYFQVDNPLVKMSDPYFIGFHMFQNSLVSSKVIAKQYPEEKLGIICKTNNKNRVIEYSDLSNKDTYTKDAAGNLKYLMGSIAIHLFSIEFLLNFTNKMPIHFAKKKVNGYNLNTTNPKIEEISGIKFETFVFDSIPLAKRSIFFKIDREEEFYPLKNKKGLDSVETCKKGQSKLYFNWLKKSGMAKEEYNNHKIEISPLYAPDEEIFLEKVSKEPDKLKKEVFNNNGALKNEIYIK